MLDESVCDYVKDKLNRIKDPEEKKQVTISILAELFNNNIIDLNNFVKKGSKYSESETYNEIDEIIEKHVNNSLPTLRGQYMKNLIVPTNNVVKKIFNRMAYNSEVLIKAVGRNNICEKEKFVRVILENKKKFGECPIRAFKQKKREKKRI